MQAKNRRSLIKETCGFLLFQFIKGKLADPIRDTGFYIGFRVAKRPILAFRLDFTRTGASPPQEQREKQANDRNPGRYDESIINAFNG
ncbi:hypothetical protein SAMN05518670_1300 [Paenibacillus sp. OK076]|nr:hypothetical protein SAMN05518670_1300 [Paenibacillus sp. OK076]